MSERSRAAGSAGDVVEIVLAGDQVTIKRNGAELGTVTSTVGQTATKHGVRSFGNATDAYDDMRFATP
jgi:hypothetical protein